ncbi:glycyl-radical enzyme activating protein [Mediterraneibacter massiliensis]|uniref:glycyl-radical enzyme activating protein n=1 Tax=Mediterraneibacter massiliensis TaxID=1720300 RepID=UPI00073E62E6|nr:glycyl-radical enzyme activating protein [Mediterraneibacter massiliensis]
MEKRIKGNVFDIQRYSIHDGPGIRTVVFLKGCPLRCKWCSNPESWNESPQLFYAASRCIGCRTCVTVCTNKEVTAEDRGLKIHWDRCKADKLDWVEQCPTKALTVKGKWMEISKVMGEIEKDIDFYRQSKGGITLSGGEPLLQPEFSYELLRLCNEKGIHTSVETTGCVPKENLEKILPVVDLFLYDIKSADTHKHKEWTGIGNEEILGNLRWISKQSKKIFVRTPMIPEVNDKEQDILDIIEILQKYSIRNYDILPFHQYGSGKYQSCGIEYVMRDVKPHDEEYVEKMRDMIRSYGFNTKVEK